jgi:hypothetical protein
MAKVEPTNRRPRRSVNETLGHRRPPLGAARLVRRVGSSRVALRFFFCPDFFLATTTTKLGAKKPRDRGIEAGSRLCSEREGSGLGERGGQLSQDRQVDVQAHAFQAADPKRQHGPLVLEATEAALDTSALVVQGLEPLGLTWDEGVQSVGLDPHGRGLALARRAAPLGRTTPRQPRRRVSPTGRPCFWHCPFRTVSPPRSLSRLSLLATRGAGRPYVKRISCPGTSLDD